MSLKNCVVVLWVYVMYLLGIWIFSSGFLLKRIVIHQNNTAIINVASDIKLFSSDAANNALSELNMTNESVVRSFTTIKSLLNDHVSNNFILSNGFRSQLFQRAVILIIDALRYDFVLYSNNLYGNSNHFSNKMPVFSHTVQNYPKQSLLMKFIADPPTTTLQRLKALTTGSFPTFIDLGFNFGSLNIEEDNLIWQLNRLNRNVIFMGDETWQSLFPGCFKRMFPFPSFNVKDLDTVDNGILSHLFDEMGKDDWHIIIAHFLGIDHCGHRYGPSHPEMTRKLQQMNNVIQNVMATIDNDTVLVVMGDHGMTATGDHGGDSSAEVHTVLFMYSPLDIHTGETVTYDSVAQVDFVPTISLLLGLPIPFSNLGIVISHLFVPHYPDFVKICCNEEATSFGPVLALAENAYQVHRYVTEYSKYSVELSSSVILKSELLLNATSALWNALVNDSKNKSHILNQLHNGYKSYLKMIQIECQDKWASFDLYLMTYGLILLTVAVILNLFMACQIRIRISTFCTCLSLFIILIFLYVTFIQNIYIFLLCLLFIFVKKSYIVTYFHQLCGALSKLCVFPTIIFIVYSASYFTNSFVVYEDAVVLFLLQATVAYRFLPQVTLCLIGASDQAKSTRCLSRKISLASFAPSLAFFCLCVCLRFGRVFHKCREEQMPCESSNFLVSLENLALENSSKFYYLFLSWCSIFISVGLVVLLFKYLNSGKCHTSTFIFLCRAGLFAAVCLSLHWWLMTVSPDVLNKILGDNQIILARCVLVTCVLMFLMAWIFPFITEKPWELKINHVLCGSLLLSAFPILLLVLLIAGSGLSSSIMFAVVSEAIVLALNRFTLHQSEQNKWTDIAIWNLLSCHWFYGTGHQSTFPALQWDAAFIFNREVFSYVICGILVGINTFSSYILYGFTLPLLQLVSQPSKNPVRPLTSHLLQYISFFGIKLLASMGSCFILRRHLMVWKIFAPKLMYEIVAMTVTMISVFTSYCFMLRVSWSYYTSVRNNLQQVWMPKNN